MRTQWKYIPPIFSDKNLPTKFQEYPSKFQMPLSSLNAALWIEPIFPDWNEKTCYEKKSWLETAVYLNAPFTIKREKKEEPRKWCEMTS